jgi:hypothetical protein
MTLIACDECGAEVSDRAWACPRCGYPVRVGNLPLFWRLGFWGYEWKSETELLGWPLVHIAFGWDLQTGKLRVARGIIAIGQFAFGLVTIAQFGIGLLIGMGQFMCGGVVVAQFAAGVVFALGQFAAGTTAIGQFTAGGGPR